MTEKTYIVTGMTCDHCAASVREEVSALSGVADVAVDVPTGKVTVTSEAEVGVDAVRAAVEGAGYQLTA
jgi:copper chaperone